MTQLIVLGGILAGFLALYMYVSNNKENYVRKNEPPNDPLNVIYLPSDLEEQKAADLDEADSADAEFSAVDDAEAEAGSESEAESKGEH